MVLSEEGHVYSFGCNDDGSLGRETQEEKECFKPDRILLEDVEVR